MRQRYYLFKFSDGEFGWHTYQGAKEYIESNPGVFIVENGANKCAEASVRSIKDGFKSGWHPGLGMHIRGQKHFREEIGRRGLEEVGNEKMTQTFNKDPEIRLDENDLRGIRQITKSISDNELKQMGEKSLDKIDL